MPLMQHPKKFSLDHLKKLVGLASEPDDGLGRRRYLNGEFERYYLNHAMDILEVLEQASREHPVAEAAIAYYHAQGAYPERAALEVAVSALLQASPETPAPEPSLSA